jgi:pyruvate decarboxylase
MGKQVKPESYYLTVSRISQLGVQSVMGVPGDMNLELLDYIDSVDGLSWGESIHSKDSKYLCTAIYILTPLTVGNANELNAAYAADGYSRVKGCPGVCELLPPLLPHQFRQFFRPLSNSFELEQW